MWLVINRPSEKSGEKHNKHTTRTMDCHLSFLIYSLVASCLHLPQSLCMGGAACRSVKITLLLYGEDLDLGLTLATKVLQQCRSVQMCSAGLVWRMFPVTASSIMLHSCNVRFTVNASFHGKTIQVSLKLGTTVRISDFQMSPNCINTQTKIPIIQMYSYCKTQALRNIQ